MTRTVTSQGGRRGGDMQPIEIMVRPEDLNPNPQIRSLVLYPLSYGRVKKRYGDAVYTVFGQDPR